jgi:ABC-type antimicrobial peptide transport system permease subunit
LAVGVPIAIASKRVTASWFENLPAEQLSIIPIAGTAMLAIALLSALLPARRAACVDPIDALRRE